MFVSAIPVSALNIKPCESFDRKTSDSVTVKFVFPQPIVSKILHYDSVEMQDLTRYGVPGEPVLPFKTAKILIPQCKELQSIHITPGNRKTLEGKFNLEYGKTPIPICSNTAVVDQPNQAIYSSSTPFPGTLFSHVSEQYLRGYEIVLLRLHPVQYVPKTGELFYYETMTVTVNIKEVGKTSLLFRNLPQDKMLILGAVDNPEVVETHTKTNPTLRPTSVNSSESYDYVIITNNDLNSSFQPLVDWKIMKGLNATTVLVEDILSDSDYFCDGLFGDGSASTFNDTAARIRNFIKDAYENWGTEYVLLGGDAEIIPTRGVYGFVDVEDPPSPYTVDRNMPCDLYYGALDGSWDNDNDTIFGEGVYDESSNSPENGTAGEEADFFAEVYIGRAPVNTPEETENFVNKTLWYEQASDDNYFKKALMIGETLDEDTEAANSVDLTTEEIPQYTMIRLYERDGTFSRSAIIRAINNGTHLLQHDGHTNPTTMMELTRDDVDTLITNTEYFLGYSLGCSCARFEIDDSIVEHFIFNSHGAFAFIGNSRYGWYFPGSLYGTGDQFARAFFDVLNNTARNLGKALQLSKEGFANQMSATRWTYLVLNLLGDPETQIVTKIMAPTAHFDTNPSPDRLSPAVLKGDANLAGIAKRGAVVGATFENFTIEFGQGTDPTSWSTTGIDLTNDGESEIANDVLAMWNTRLVTYNRIYTLKLTVYDENDRVGEDRWIVKVKRPTTVQVDPELTEKLVPQTFTVDVEINNVEELYELEIYFSWNTTLVDYVDHTVYGLLNDPVTDDEVNQTTGVYWIWSESQYPAEPFEGSGPLFEMTFQAKAAGTCILNISSSELLKRFGESITHDVLSGTVQISPGVHDVAVTNTSVSKTVACQGLCVDIYVTVENEGSYDEYNFNVTAYANETAVETMQVSLTSYSHTVITLAWNTIEFAVGNYTISANATVVPGEDDTADNIYIYGTVTVVEPSFDIAVVDISLNKTVVGEGCSAFINVTVENQADLTCTFNVTAYADLNATIIGDEIIIGIQNVTLTGENSTIITFMWTTASVAHGNYTISAYATPLEAEADLEDNTYTDNWIVVTIPGDVDGDSDVDLFDAVKLLSVYGAKAGSPDYDPNLDINGNGQIFLFDAVMLLSHYGEKDP